MRAWMGALCALVVMGGVTQAKATAFIGALTLPMSDLLIIGLVGDRYIDGGFSIPTIAMVPGDTLTVIVTFSQPAVLAIVGERHAGSGGRLHPAPSAHRAGESRLNLGESA